EYRSRADAWLLGRFVVPVARLGEFERAAYERLRAADAAGAPWRIAALAGADLAADVDAVADFNARHAMGDDGGAAVIDAVELKADDVAGVAAAARVVPNELDA